MSGFSHFINFVLVILTSGFWLPVWILIALCCASGNRKRSERKKDEELALLREIAGKQRYK